MATVRGGDDRASLEAIRDGLATAIEAAAPNEVAPLAKQLVDVIERLAASAPVKEGSKRDDLKAKRQQRRAGASASAAGGQ